MTFAEYVVLRDASLDENFVRSAVDQFKQSYGAAKGSAMKKGASASSISARSSSVAAASRAVGVSG